MITIMHNIKSLAINLVLYHSKSQTSLLQIRVDTQLHSLLHLECSILMFTLISLAKVSIKNFVQFSSKNSAYEFAIDQIKKINNPELFEEQEEEEEKTEEAQAEEQTEEAAEGAVEETPSQEPAAE